MTMSTLNHPSVDESLPLNLHASPAPDQVAGAPPQAINDSVQPLEAVRPIGALDALARCMAESALGS
jgi:hypothetical protein